MARKPKEVDLPEPAEGMVNVVVICDHIYVPLDERGNVRPEWKDVPGRVPDAHLMSISERLEWTKAHDCKAVSKRARLAMPEDLAIFLADREQVEIL